MSNRIAEFVTAALVVCMIFATGAIISVALSLLSISDSLVMLEIQQHRIANSYDKLLEVQRGNDQVPDRMLRNLPLEQRDKAPQSVPVD